jgi:transposase
MFAWYWLADLCREEKIEFVLGHALYMKAVHGGKAKSDKIDAHKIAVLLRGGMFPLAYVYPPEMRATRDLLRRRNFFVRKRAELMAHIQNTGIQYNLPPLGIDLTCEESRHEVAQLFPNPEVKKSIEIDVAMIDAYDDVLKVLEPNIEKTARQHNKHALTLLRSIHGVGKVLGLVMLYYRFRIPDQTGELAALTASSGQKPGLNGPLRGDNYPDTGGLAEVRSLLRYDMCSPTAACGAYKGRVENRFGSL